MSGNPFDPMGPSAVPPQQQQQAGYGGNAGYNDPNANGSTAANPFGAAAPSANVYGSPPPNAMVVAPQQSNPYAAAAAAAPQSNPYGAPPPAGAAQSNPYGAPPGAAAAPQPNPYGAPPQSNPYGAPAPPPQSNPYGAPPAAGSAAQANPFAPADANGSTALVPSQTQNSQWAAAPAGGFDPFAAPPAAPPAPPPQVYAPPAPTENGGMVDFQQESQPPVQQQEPPAVPPAQTKPTDLTQNLNRYDPSEGEQQQANARTYGNVDRMNPDQNYGKTGDAEAPQRVAQQREQQTADMGRQLAQTAPGASPLPKPELIRKKGFVLSRISFRTIVMKKWKQSFWVQYGPHTMLWFRSDTDFNDWLNNPYHNQVQRNFLIKLAVNFVHDLYKPSVRGYQVTQCRTKGYGSKMIRQFKLERWMDYGPTIAAAFGSYNPKEVDELRQAIVECMRNTPLSNGIRATGAVRQQPSRESEDDSDRRHQQQQVDNGESDRREYARADGVAQPNAHTLEQNGNDADLLDVNNWDDVSVQQHSVAPSVHVGSEQFVANGQPGPPPQQPPQQPYSNQPPPQQPYSNQPPQYPYSNQPPQQQPYPNQPYNVGPPAPQPYPTQAAPAQLADPFGVYPPTN